MGKEEEQTVSSSLKKYSPRKGSGKRNARGVAQSAYAGLTTF
ncbi:hypothetical protein [Leisingera sp. ANG59]|nr:hypothetical protein [Leisingera sp. ANG59]